MYDSFMVYTHATDKNLLKFKPKKEETIKSAAGELSEDLAAWLTVDGTPIDFPVMQGRNNSEYLNKDPYGRYSLSGSVFLDSRNSRDFSDPYSLIYGHHMDGGAMFGALDSYLKKGYLENHRTGALVTQDGMHEIEFFAVTDAPGTEPAVFDPTLEEGPAGYVKEHAMYYTDGILKEGDRIIALSTCKYPDAVDRTIVFGVLK